MLLGTLAASLLGNILASKTKRPGERVIEVLKETIIVGQRFLMPPHPKMQKCYQKESIFIGAISRNNLPTIQVGRYIIMMINRSLLLCLLSYRNRLYSKRIKENNRQQKYHNKY